MQAIIGHSGDLLLRMTASACELVWHKAGHLVDPGQRDDEVLIVADPDDHMVADPTVEPPLLSVTIEPHLLFTFPGDAADAQAERYSGGVRLRLDVGEFTNHTLTIVFWHGILHEPPSGDIAPGFGEFRATAE